MFCDPLPIHSNNISDYACFIDGYPIKHLNIS